MKEAEIRKLEIELQEQAKQLNNIRIKVKDRRCKLNVFKENIRYHRAGSKIERKIAKEATGSRNYNCKRVAERAAKVNEELMQVNIELYKEAIMLWKQAQQEEQIAAHDCHVLATRIDHMRRGIE